MSDDSDGGFTLLEMVCVIALIAMLAAVLLPYIPRAAAGLCIADRDAAEG
jgi:prepilin-type N-terminal cleavage/methylation domain-containing protein